MDNSNTQFAFVIISMIVVIGSFVLIAAHFKDAKNIEDTTSTEIFEKQMEKHKHVHNGNMKYHMYLRAKAIVDAFIDTMDSILLNTNDPIAAYRIWSSNMFKRGLDAVYIAPVLFDQCAKLYEADNLTNKEVYILLPMYFKQEMMKHHEKEATTHPMVLKPFCMNF